MEIRGIIYQRIQSKGIDDYWIVSKCNSNEDSLSIEHEIEGAAVKGIAPYAFQNRTALIHVNMPDTIEYIGERAFASCISLRTVFIQVTNTVEKPDIMCLYEACFHNCTELTSIIGDKIMEFEEPYVFKNCENLNTFGYNNKIAGDLKSETFHGCISLEKIHLTYQYCHLNSNSLLNCVKLKTIRFDSKKVTMAKSVLATLINKNIICGADCNLTELAYLGVNITIE